MKDQTLFIVKPDAVSRGLTGRILARVEEEGFRLEGLRLLRLRTSEAEAFYEIHRERPFYRDLVEYMTSGPVVVAALSAEGAVSRLRHVVGETDPARARAGSIRAEFGVDIQRNSVHASDSPENASREVDFFFGRGPAAPASGGES